jgi:hypothetical protein
LKTQGPAPPSSHRGGFPNNNNIITTGHQAHQAPEYGATPKEIYNAEDFQYQKRQEVEMKMREKEAEMRSYFEVPRPKEIDFSDIPRDSHPRTIATVAASGTDGNGDSPLANGDDMDKLIAERIAARQRDLDIIGERMKATMPAEERRRLTQPAEYNPNDVSPVDASPTPMPMPPPALQSVETRNVPEDIRRVRFQEEDTNPIFLKLKRKPMVDDE